MANKTFSIYLYVTLILLYTFLYVVTNMVLQDTFSVIILCVKYFKAGCYTHRDFLTYVACKCCVLCWQAWFNMHVVMPFCKFCRIFPLSLFSLLVLTIFMEKCFPSSLPCSNSRFVCCLFGIHVAYGNDVVIKWLAMYSLYAACDSFLSPYLQFRM